MQLHRTGLDAKARGYLNGRGRWWAWWEVWDGGVGEGMRRFRCPSTVLELGGPDCCCPLTEKDKFAVSPHHATLALGTVAPKVWLSWRGFGRGRAQSPDTQTLP